MQASHAPSPIGFLLPGDPSTPTGGYRYDARLIAGLRAIGHRVRQVSLSATFPSPDDAALADADAALSSFDDGRLVIVDGLAFGAMPTVAARHARRLKLVALVHHPLALETGLPPTEAERLADSERAALACVRAVIVTSTTTAASLRQLRMDLAPITVAEPGIEDWPVVSRPVSAGPVLSGPAAPGTAPESDHESDHGPAPEPVHGAAPEPAHGPARGPARKPVHEPVHGPVHRPAPRPVGHTGTVNLLSVATVTPRKGHLLLVEALRRLEAGRGERWHLTCAGALDRDPLHVSAVRRCIADAGLGDRITLAGAVSDEALRRLYARADLFVSAAWWEGYGMAAAQAIAVGLPVVTTTGGALASTVPADASLQVPTGDAAALSAAIGRCITDSALRERLAAAARAAGPSLPRWPATVARVAALLRAVSDDTVPDR
ncbi:MAG TPA: glycosyltransferase family 4 protein [Burkholderiaceae bacterium]|nr:glycosyltransferase family 4 protein [Burkholderiaceae bacterium]